MTEIPMWWLVVSGIFFVLAIVLTAALAIAVFKMMSTVKTLQEKLEQTIKKGEAVVDRLEGVAKTAQNTVDSIGGSARNVVSRVEGAVSSTAERVEPVMAFLAIASAGMQLYHQFAAIKKARQSHASDDAEDD